MKRIIFTVAIATVCLCAKAQQDVSALQARIDSLTAANEKLEAENQKLKTLHDGNSTDGERQVCPDDVQDIAITGATVNASHEDSAFAYRQEPQPATPNATAESALSQLKKTTDDKTGITTYEYSKGIFSDGNQCTIYLTQQDTSVSVRINIIYTDSHPLSFSEVWLSYDGNTIAVPFTNDNKSRKTSGSPKAKKYREELDVAVDAATVAFIKHMKAGTKAELRLKGKSTVMRRLTKGELRAINIVLDAYDELIAGM